MTSASAGLRHRNNPQEQRQHHNGNGITNNDMAYAGRRNFVAYQRSGVNPNASLPNTRSLASYRNRSILILLVTSIYTAFLYQRGQ
jgi:hypothetical protein